MSRPSLLALLDRIVPTDEHPGAGNARAAAHVAERALGSASIWPGLDCLDREAHARFGLGFERLAADRRDQILTDLERGSARAEWTVCAPRWLDEVCSLAAEAMYAVASAPGKPPPLFEMLGYPGDSPDGLERPFPTGRDGVVESVDAVVVGAGVAGSLVASVLASAGLSTLIIERGDDARQRALARDHLRNHRLSLLGHGTGPPLSGHPRAFVDARGRRHVVAPNEPGYHNNASCIGGGGLVFGGMAWRFDPRDFRMASTYGVPKRSSLADWPLSYADLAPHYARVEWDVGVAGSGPPSPASPAERYPMPAHPGHPGRGVLKRAADRLGWSTRGVPLLINSQPRARRAACVRCAACVGFACPSDAKNSSHNAMLWRAVETGQVQLVRRATVTRVDTGAQGRVCGVTYLEHGAQGPEERSVRAGRVIVAAGAIESARLLLASASAREPRGLGNQRDQVGRHLQGHVYVSATGRMLEEVEDGRGPGPSVATTEFVHDNPSSIGGGLLSDDFVLLPIVAFRDHLPPRSRRWGLEAKRFMRDNYRKLLKVTGPVHEIPNPDCRVTLDPDLKDRWGRPVARLSGTVHPETVATARFLHGRAVEWLRESGAAEVYGSPPNEANFLSAGQHQAGTCRMGEDPSCSVTDPFGRVHGHDNLYVMDASVHVTNGSFNPALTIMALALRSAEALIDSL